MLHRTQDAPREATSPDRRTAAATASVIGLAAFVVALHLATAGRYGVFRDELYYLACARHLDWGYVDHPPLIAGVTWLVVHTLGTSLAALRLAPALAAGALVLMAAALARELDGGPAAQVFAAFAVVPVPIFLLLDHWLTMNAFEPLLWTGIFWCAARMIRTDDARLWLPIGVLTGVGLETKYSIVVCVAGLVLGVAATRERRRLLSPWAAAAAALALLLFLPNLLWLVAHHFPFLEFELHSRQGGSRILRGPLAFTLDQALIMNPFLAPLGLTGAGWLLLAQGGRRRSLGWAAVAIFAVLMLLKAKNYYVAPLYPLLFAAGSVAIEAVWPPPARALYAAAVAACGIVLAPLVMPILQPQDFLRYRQALGGLNPVMFENLPDDILPQYFADEFGWEAMAQRTAAAFMALPASERAHTAIFANDYGQAAAIDAFGPALGLPPVISKNVSYWLWGPRGFEGRTVIVLGSDGDGEREHCGSVEPVGRVGVRYARTEERFTLFLCRHLAEPLPAMWPRMKAY